jgi:hypothetical protein
MFPLDRPKILQIQRETVKYLAVYHDLGLDLILTIGISEKFFDEIASLNCSGFILLIESCIKKLYRQKSGRDRHGHMQ